MKPDDLMTFNESLDRCTSRPGFFDAFYETFLQSSEDVAKKFEGVDMVKQRRVLKTSLYMIILAAEEKEEGQVHLQKLARVHSKKERDIPPEMYDLWLDCLINTARKFDPIFYHEIERTWREVMQAGIKFMKSRYE